MPWDALPDELNPYKNPNAWKGTDDDTWGWRWRIKIKGWFAYGPLSKHWWAKWREYPITLLAFFGKGQTRLEDSLTTHDVMWHNGPIVWFDPAKMKSAPKLFLSRVQYYARWHFQVQWPLYVGFHFYPRKQDVPVAPNHANTDGKIGFFYLGAHRDGTPAYWFPSAYFGRNWK